jgi:hypothetical protein
MKDLTRKDNMHKCLISSHHIGGADECERRISGHQNGCVPRELGGRTDLHENPLAPYLSPTFIVVSTSQIKEQCSAFVTVPCCP